MTAVSDRVPPNDLAAEAAVLGSVIMDNAVLIRLAGVVSSGDFYADRHRRIWDHMQALAEKGLAIDHVTLAAALRAAGDISRIGGIETLAAICDGVATTVNAESYAAVVRDLATARRIVRAAQEIYAAGTGGVTDVGQFVTNARKGIADACGTFGTERGVAKTLDDDLRRVWTDVVERTQPTGLIPTGISTLDRVSGGLWPGVVTIVAARPGMGKSAFVLNIAINAALAGKRVLLVTLEDTRYFIAVRMLARFAKIDNIALTMRSIRADQHRPLLDGYNRACGLPLWVDDVSGLSSAELRARVIAHRDAHGIDLLVLDHLAEMREDAESETAVVSMAARGTRDIVKELNIPGLIAHQLNRKVEDRADKRPTLSDLKQSGKVEEVARSVIFLYRPGYYEEDGEDRRDLWAIIAKANHGKTGMAKCWANLAEMYVRGWEPSDGEFPGMSRTSEAPAPRQWHRADGTPVNSQRSPYKDEY